MRKAVRRKPCRQKGRHVLVAADLLGQRPIRRREDQAAFVAREPQPPIARGVVANLNRHVLRHIVFGELVEGSNDLGRGTPAAQAFQIDNGVMR